MSRPASNLSSSITVRNLGLQDYEPLWRAMQRFTDTRTAASADEIWFTEHPPVFTLGLNASRDHLLATGDIPVVQIDPFFSFLTGPDSTTTSSGNRLIRNQNAKLICFIFKSNWLAFSFVEQTSG